MSKAKLTRENIINLLTQSAEVEFEEEQNQAAFNFQNFCQDNLDLVKKMSITSCLTFLKNRQSIMKVIKQSDFTFGRITIKKTSERIGATDMTFRRLDSMIRVKLIQETANAVNLDAIKTKIASHPLVQAYGLPLNDAKSVRLAIMLGGSIPLIASVDSFEMISVVLAIYQDAKCKDLGINPKKYDTKEALGKVCTVLKSKGFSMDDTQVTKGREYAAILGSCNPNAKGSVAMEHYSEHLNKFYEMFGVKKESKISGVA
uniref:Nucleoprotein n=2 Tax=Alstroemeria necrotic streak virus TaxID=693450 RepID=D1L612_9VIRU|nr:nucleocapsid protein [Alstroemeria necrotic streak virus]AWV56668.1 nucleocapsid protein [Alstroemeria necrotic streak virus]QCI62357.1 nucleocapsid protein [Alstroemeria necrotic streak virus]WMX25402.1 nucleocapsid protein [Alstroemeria necrotic streak virus]